jgi:hypothetical protein
VIVELLSVAAIVIGGCLLVRTAGMSGWGVLPFGVAAGMCLQIGIGLVQVVTNLPTWPALTLALTVAIPLGWWLLRWRQGYDVRLPIPYAAAALAGLAVAVLLLRAANLVKWHIDSFTYTMVGALLADDTYRAGVSPFLVTKRLLGVPVLHAPAQPAGEAYLRSITPLLAAATLGIVAWLFQRGLRDRLDRAALYGFTGAALLLLVSNNRFVFHTFYLNGHLLAAVQLLMIAGCGWLLRSRDDPALRLIQLVAVPALIVTRPEGVLLAALALLPTVVSGRVPVRHRAAACAVLGVATLAWQASVLWVHLDRDTEIPMHVYGAAAVGVLALAGIAALRFRLPAALLWLTEAGLWLVLAGFAVRDPAVLVDSVNATVVNAARPTSAWGVSLVVLGLLVLAAMLVTGTGRFAGPLRFPVTTFPPVAFLLAYLREGGAFRIGQGDSFNRMLIEVVPLAVLFVVVAFAGADWARIRPVVTTRRSEAVQTAEPPAGVAGAP